VATIDVQWALEHLRRFVAMTTTHRTGDGWVRTAQTDEVIIVEAPVVEKILTRVTPHWQTTVSKDFYNRWGQRREAAQRAITELEREAELREKLGDDAPTLSAGYLHPWVWEGARSLWQSGHYREAVAAAARKVNAETQNKVGRRDLSEVKLFNDIFSPKPAPGRPRLRLTDDDGGKTYENVHRGAMVFADGCYTAIRNPAAHEVQEELPEDEALEQLAAFSVLARWIDQAKVVTS
jgi:uncharacterized protein (TIGR02391 family)